MQKESMNPYYNARTYAGLTRPGAAVRLNISERSLAEYELDGRPTPEDIVLKMAELYRTPWLRVQHLQRNAVFCDIFGLVPQMQDRSLNVLRVQKEVTDVARLLPEIVDHALERVKFNGRLLKECREGAQALLLLIGSEKEVGKC